MISKFLEFSNGPNNWGKFLISVLEPEEWNHHAIIDPGRPLLRTIGWAPHLPHALVFDLQTREGAAFVLSGHAPADLEKHKIWVCPLFEPMLNWLYMRYREIGAAWFDTLPVHVDIPDAPFEFRGYRRSGPDKEDRQ